jgi:hypothetical protein
MATFEEFSLVRLREGHVGHDAYGVGGEHNLPAGSVGTVVALLGGGAAYEVEFTVREPQFDGDQVLDAGEYHHVSLRPHQIAPA